MEGSITALGEREDSTVSTIGALQRQHDSLERKHMTLEGKATATEKSVATISERVRSTEGAVFGLSAPMDHSIDAGREAEAPTRHAESDEVAELRAKIAQLEQGSSASRQKLSPEPEPESIASRREDSPVAAQAEEGVPGSGGWLRRKRTSSGRADRSGGGTGIRSDSMVGRLDETAVEVRLLSQRVLRLEAKAGLTDDEEEEPGVSRATFEAWTKQHEQHVRAYNEQVRVHEESLERTNVEHQHRLENLEQKMAVAVATATAIADTVRSEHDELSERIGAAAAHSEEVEQQLHAQIDALGVSMRMAGVRSPGHLQCLSPDSSKRVRGCRV